MKKIKNIVRLKNGDFVKDWQYSQGYFDIAETSDILEAVHIDDSSLTTFFNKPEYEHLVIEISATIQK